MTRAGLVSRISVIYPYMNLRNVDRIVSIIFDMMTDKLRDGGRVELRDFGAFSTKERAKTLGRNPKSGETVEIRAKKIPFFKAGKKLKDLLNESEG